MIAIIFFTGLVFNVTPQINSGLTQRGDKEVSSQIQVRIIIPAKKINKEKQKPDSTIVIQHNKK